MHTNFNDNYLGSGKLILRAIKKYGVENFSREIIDYAKTKEELGQLERKYIKQYNATKSNNFYNIHEGGFGGCTIDGFSEEELNKYKQKMSESLLKREYNNKPMSQQTRDKISKSRILYWQNISDDDKKNFQQIMSEAVKGEKNPNYGNYWTDEQKQKLSKKIKDSGKRKGNKNPMYNKKDENAINGKKVFMYDKNFNLLKIFNTLNLALKFLGLKGHTQLNNAIRNKTMYKGYYWSKQDKNNKKV